MEYERDKEINVECSNEEYREKLKSIFEGIEQKDRLRFWYRYVRAIEKGED